MTEIDPNTPIRLADILPLAFPQGGMTTSGLRKEAKRGHLTIMRMAGKDFTTLAYIKEMQEKCRVSENQPASGSAQPMKTAPPSGSSLMEENKSALAAARAIADRLKGNSRNISPADLWKSRRANTETLQK